MFAIDDSASSFCAREMRGTLSIASTVSLRPASCCMSSGFCAGQMKLTSVLPGSQRRDLVGGRRAHLEDDVGARRELGRGECDLARQPPGRRHP